jgi:large subunit ribosomal protein L13
MDKVKDCTIDASGKILGRLAVEAANILRGKNKPGFLRHKDTGESVVVFNTDKIKVTGKKMTQKKYHNYSGYPGGLKSRRLEEMMEKDSREVVRKAILGMMPKNRLSNQMITKLKLYKREIKA